ncbi:NAD-dependent epimerase/dehydratase family protein [Hahella sp. HN01]|uniref:NAD-dependent epimerase/dehydratase family protein n=1 Tax=Hahella sp. HN01 TaxID=2847262 RepID=UPI001C1F1B4B|nr:NAD-dependent epimerase/dehydratase family protein [Hahella sp. HN01]MBU6955956.1 NAD-dependent epimerase/dehydratase family protein [Hahella sp. HN01]
MKVGVIGATGMLGHHTAAALLARGHEVVVIHRKDSDLSKIEDLHFEARIGDLRDEETLAGAMRGLDVVINCAGYYPTTPNPWRRDVELALAQEKVFYQACKVSKVKRIVYVGGSIALPKNPTGEPAGEDQSYSGQPQNKNAYVQAKWAMDDLALKMAAEGLPVCIAIPSMTFGEYDYGPSTGQFLLGIVNQTLPAYVEGNRNCIYAGDAGLGIALVCEKGRVGERYLLTNENIAMSNLASKVVEIGNSLFFSVNPQDGKITRPKIIPLTVVKALAKIQRIRYRYFNGSTPKITDTAIAVMSSGQFLSGDKAKRELGFEASVSLDDAVKRTLLWFKSVGYINASRGERGSK